MGNHLHLLVQTHGSNPSQFMKRVLGLYTIRFNRRHKRHGHLFQGRYKSILVDQDSYFLELSRYIHLNPVKSKIVQRPEDYAWSSLKYFLKSQAPDYLNRKFTLDSFKSAQEYLAYVYEGIDAQDVSMPRPTAGCILGSVEFIKNFKKQIQKHQTRDVSGKRELYRVPVDKLNNLIAQKDNSYKMYCLWRYGRLTQRQIGRLFSKTHAAASQNIYRFKARLAEDGVLKSDMDQLLSEFKG